MSDRVLIFDTVLRDGKQAGHKLDPQSKLAYARQAARCGVDVIEAGFPVSSIGDAESVSLIARGVQGPIICALARAVDEDIDIAWQAIQAAVRPRIHTFISTSDVHIKKKLRSTRKAVLAMAQQAVARAKSYCHDVEFSPEDATRTEP